MGETILGSSICRKYFGALVPKYELAVPYNCKTSKYSSKCINRVSRSREVIIYLSSALAKISSPILGMHFWKTVDKMDHVQKG